jgi:hypothetical protein
MNDSIAKRARFAIKSGLCKSTAELMKYYNLTKKEATRCERVVFGREFVKGRIKFKRNV